ncbi:hypothetical protein AV955_gp002 [Diadromus pulchellus ascovirus 4a]|uniref:Complete DpAV4 genome n=1 Tax=Diadromus pulchellus ascovirus 4a TaxID=158683 RepID=F2NYT1_9VIRU|nr:hypothetical protein AV955_gp002 [Diadromus pulchellus ascovirus 4a]CCA61359.1 unnamed protein product [Diadromus pulchellus ascovirus 4a]
MRDARSGYGVGVRAASIRQPGLYLRASVCGRSGVDPGQIFATTKDLQGEENRYIELLQPPPSHVRDSSHGDIRVLPIFSLRGRSRSVSNNDHERTSVRAYVVGTVRRLSRRARTHGRNTAYVILWSRGTIKTKLLDYKFGCEDLFDLFYVFVFVLENLQ